MADLIDRLSGESERLVPPRPKLSPHAFVCSLRLYVDGTATSSEIVTSFDLQGSELTQAQVLISKIDSLTPAINKLYYVLRVEAVVYLMEMDEDELYHNPDGSVDKTRVQTDLEL